MSNKKQWVKWLGVICPVIFIFLALAYFKPVLLQNILPQNDIINYLGGAEERISHKESTGEETYWTNSMFGGMPTYQLGAQYKNDYIGYAYNAFNFLPRPANFLFILLAGFFILGLVLFKKWQYALLGSVLFAFSTYFFIIIEAGHNTKLTAIAYFAPLVAGILLIYNKKYFIGFILTAFFMALEIYSNHLQMTYYLFLAMLLFLPFQLYDSYKKGEIKSFIKSSIVVVIAVAFGLGMNSARLYTTYDYTKETIRGKGDADTPKSSGLDYDYITQWSYGKLETLNLLIPNFMGGSSMTDAQDLTNYTAGLQNKLGSQEEYEMVQQYVSPTTYWGDQPFTSGPAYQGAVVIFLFLLGLYIVPGKLKWWLLSATILSLVLAWGNNIQWLTSVLIDHLPLYNKFRAVSSALVISEFTIPILAVMAVYFFFSNEVSTEKRKKSLLYVGGGTLLFLVLIYILGPVFLDFISTSEAERINTANTPAVVKSLMEDLIKDRQVIFKEDTIRSFLLILASVIILGLYAFDIVKKKEIVISLLGILAVGDLWGIDKRYLNDENFVKDYLIENPFPTEATEDLQSIAQTNPVVGRMISVSPVNAKLEEIKKTDSSQYRVFNTLLSPFNETNTSYYHQSIGGYHGAKLRSYQDIIDKYLSSNINFEVLNMLNTKYVLVAENDINVVQNPEANGNAWFVKEIKWVNDEKEELAMLGQINTKKVALLTKNLENKESPIQASIDSSGNDIKLIQYQPDHLTYKVKAKQDGLAVFSEIYYPRGWKAYKNSKPGAQEEAISIMPADYLLRASMLPAGEYYVDFFFEPDEVKKGEKINLLFYILFLIAVLVCAYFIWKRKEINL